jgi:hypothetical protein
MKPNTTKPLTVARQMANATVSVENTSQTPTALGPQLEDPPRVTTATVTPVVAAAVLEVVAVMVAVVEAAAEAHPIVLAEDLVAVAIAEAEAARIAMPPTTHVAATMPAIGLRRSVTKRLLKQAIATTSPPTQLATCSFLRSSNLLRSPNMM